MGEVTYHDFQGVTDKTEKESLAKDLGEKSFVRTWSSSSCSYNLSLKCFWKLCQQEG